MPSRNFITIYDTGIVIQATLAPSGVAALALQWMEDETVEAIVNTHLRWEYEHVLHRMAADGDHPQLARPNVIETQLARIDATMRLVINAPRQIVYPRDPNDEQTIDLVIYTQADFLVARDKDLLTLNNDPEFRRVCPRTRVVNPVEFLQEMEREKAGRQWD